MNQHFQMEEVLFLLLFAFNPGLGANSALNNFECIFSPGRLKKYVRSVVLLCKLEIQEGTYRDFRNRPLKCLRHASAEQRIPMQYGKHVVQNKSQFGLYFRVMK